MGFYIHFPKTAVLVFCTALLIHAQYPNIRVDNNSISEPEEVCIAINPTDPLNLAAGSNRYYYYYSKDGGETWDGARMQTSFVMVGDPCVTFDPEGNLYFGHISDPPFGSYLDRIVVHKSTDGGETWSDGVDIGKNGIKVQDKEWLIADHTNSQYRGTIYMAWTQFDEYGSADPSLKTRLLFSRSTDKGESWSSPAEISDTTGDCLDTDNTLMWAMPAVGLNGEVYVCWAAHSKIYLDKSLDGGITFGKDAVVAEQPDGWKYEIPGIYRNGGYPVMCCDISTTRYGGNVYVSWADLRNGATNADIFFIKSADGGQTWSDIKRVNDDTSNRHQFFHWMCVDQKTGYIYFVFYDRRNTTGDATDVYVASSKDGGETFENFKVSESSFTPSKSIFFGDYASIAADNGKIYPLWMRLDGTKLSLWTTHITEQVAIDESDQKTIAENAVLLSRYTNPYTLRTTLSLKLVYATKVSLSVYNTKGVLIQRLLHGEYKSAGVHTFTWNARDAGTGVYFYKITAGDYETVVKDMVRK